MASERGREKVKDSQERTKQDLVTVRDFERDIVIDSERQSQ